MSRTSKSPRRVAIAALLIGQQVLPDYAHRFAPKTFTQPQLLACLVLMRFHKTDFRGVCAILDDSPTIRRDLGLKRTPHFTTLHKAQRRLMRHTQARLLLGASARQLKRRRFISCRAAADSTGFESSRISPYFVRRRDRSSGKATTAYYTRFPKLHVIVDCKTHLVLAAYPKRGPTPDAGEFVKLYTQLAPGIDLHTLYADAGYDSEANHVFLRDDLHVHSLIPARIGRPTTKPARGKHRRLMQRLFADPASINYGQRWQAETVFSMIKRNLGHAISARSYHAQNREMLLNCITHNAMILWLIAEVFYRAGQTPFGGFILAC